MKIVLDATVLVSSFHLRGPKFQLFEWYLRNESAKLVVPQIVVEEVKNKFREKAIENFEMISKSVSKLANHLDRGVRIPISSSDLDSYFENYNQQLDEKLTSYNTEIPSHEDIPHQVIVDRDLARKKPFRKVGKGQESTGYRDTLIWEVILRKVAPESDLVVFVTGNKKDFWDTSVEGLHRDLSHELVRNSMPHDRVVTIKDIDSFNEIYVKAKIPAVEEAKILLEQGKYYDFSIKSWLDENTTDIITELEKDIDIPLNMFDLEADSISIDWIEYSSKISVDQVFEIDTNKVFIDVSLKAAFSLDINTYSYVYWGELADLPLDVSIQQCDDRYAHLSMYIELPINLSLIFNISTKTVDEFEGHLPEIYGWCRFCREPYFSNGAETCSKCGR